MRDMKNLPICHATASAARWASLMVSSPERSFGSNESLAFVRICISNSPLFYSLKQGADFSFIRFQNVIFWPDAKDCFKGISSDRIEYSTVSLSL